MSVLTVPRSFFWARVVIAVGALLPFVFFLIVVLIATLTASFDDILGIFLFVSFLGALFLGLPSVVIAYGFGRQRTWSRWLTITLDVMTILGLPMVSSVMRNPNAQGFVVGDAIVVIICLYALVELIYLLVIDSFVVQR